MQVVLHADDDSQTVVREVFTLTREAALTPDTVGLQLQEAKDLLAAVQDTLVEHQVATALSAQAGMPGLRKPVPAQGQPAHRGAHLVRRAAFG